MWFRAAGLIAVPGGKEIGTRSQLGMHLGPVQTQVAQINFRPSAGPLPPDCIKLLNKTLAKTGYAKDRLTGRY